MNDDVLSMLVRTLAQTEQGARLFTPNRALSIPDDWTIHEITLEPGFGTFDNAVKRCAMITATHGVGVRMLFNGAIHTFSRVRIQSSDQQWASKCAESEGKK